MLEDGATAQGSVTMVQRVGETIRRPTGPWTAVVHALLRHLEAVGFAGAPRVLGFDSEGREIVSLVQGEPMTRPWAAVLREGQGLEALGAWLRDYHAAVESFVPPSDAQWRVPGLVWRPGQIVRHGDLGPWNTIWAGNTLVGAIDWDFAEPGDPLDDVAQVAWYTIPLRGPEQWHIEGFERPPDLRRRFHRLCESYGAAPSAVLEALLRLQQLERERILTLAAQGCEPWVRFAQRGDAAQMAMEAAWVAEMSHSLGR